MILLAIYVLYMFLFFETTLSFNHPLEYYIFSNLNDEYFYHPISSTEYGSKICKFGKDIIWLLAIYLIYKSYFNVNKNINMFIVAVTFILSLMNFNAVIYLLPYFIYELIQSKS